MDTNTGSNLFKDSHLNHSILLFLLCLDFLTNKAVLHNLSEICSATSILKSGPSSTYVGELGWTIVFKFLLS